MHTNKYFKVRKLHTHNKICFKQTDRRYQELVSDKPPDHNVQMDAYQMLGDLP